MQPQGPMRTSRLLACSQGQQGQVTESLQIFILTPALQTCKKGTSWQKHRAVGPSYLLELEEEQETLPLGVLLREQLICRMVTASLFPARH